MIPVLYPPNTTDFSSFGLGVLTDTISCEVTEERNGVFECLLKYPVSGQHYGLITKECIIKAKPNDTAADQAFRIYRITKPLNGIVTIYGQHISYDLANVPVLPFSTESRSPQLILSQLLAGDTRFTGWTDYSDAKAFSVTQPKSVRACLGGTEGSMLSKWYGEFEWDNFTVKFHSHRGQKTGVIIEYGKNLTALEQDEDNSGVYTALLPYAVYTPEGAETETVVTLPEVTLPIVTPEIVRAKTLIMDFSDQFDGVVTEEALRAKANSYSFTTDISTAWGVLYESGAIALPNFPFTFAEIPHVHISTENSNYAMFVERGSSSSWSTTTNPGKIFAVRPNTVPSATYKVSIYAIGKA